MMCSIRLRKVVAAFLVAGLVGAGAALVMGQALKGPPDAKAAAGSERSPRPPAKPEGPAVRANAKARLEAARQVYEGRLTRYKNQGDFPLDLEQHFMWSRRWAEAQLELAPNRKESLAAVQSHVDRMKWLKKTIENEIKASVRPRYDASAAEFYRLDAERWLARIRAK
jgi:hypothetical protein